MAPEQLRGEPADHRADVCSFGAILYEILAGEVLFNVPTPVDALRALQAPPQLERRPGFSRLPPTVERIVRRCVQRKPEDRSQSSSDLAFALDLV